MAVGASGAVQSDAASRSRRRPLERQRGDDVDWLPAQHGERLVNPVASAHRCLVVFPAAAARRCAIGMSLLNEMLSGFRSRAPWCYRSRLLIQFDTGNRAGHRDNRHLFAQDAGMYRGTFAAAVLHARGQRWQNSFISWA